MLLRAFVALLIASIPALAQSHVFVYVAPGGVATWSPSLHGDAFVHLGGGGEFVLKNGLGVGADAGAMGELFGGTTGTFSLDGSYHFRRQRLVDPFVLAGYSLFFHRNSGDFIFGPNTSVPSANLFNFGGGTNLWFSHHVGAKLEFRDHLHSENGSIVHYAEFMMGVGFH
jgi:Outer membrane protein beta-barrel domain